MTDFKPFDNDTQSTTLADLTFENGTEEVVIYGDTTITKDTKASEIDAIIEVFTKIRAKLKS